MNQIIDIAYTGKSQASALDVQSCKESEFLERYSRYILKDECQNILTDSTIWMQHILDPKRVSHQKVIQYKTQNIHNLNNRCHVFFSIRATRFAQFSAFYDKILEQFNVYNREDFNRSIRTVTNQKTAQQKKQLFYTYQPSSFDEKNEQQNQKNFYELYSNHLGRENDTLNPGDIIIFDSRIKCPSRKARELQRDMQRLIDQTFKSTKQGNHYIESEYLLYLREQKNPIITLILLFNGDVNFDFDRHLKLHAVNIADSLYPIRLRVYYVSKQALFSHFRERNNQQKIEMITDRIVTFYDINKSKQLKTAYVEEIEKLKQEMVKNKQKDVVQRRARNISVLVVAIGFLVIGGIMIAKKIRTNKKS